jgi:two-component system nitrate/nitrite response regulator NarL
VSTVITVVIADAQSLFRDGLARVIRQDAGLQLLREADDGRAVVASIRELAPDVALVARDLPGLDGERVVAAVSRERLPTRVVVLDTAPGAHVWELLGGGAAGVLSRRVTPDGLRAAVRRAADGGTALCEESQAAVGLEIRGRQAGSRPLLSAREQQILELVGDGQSAPQIARRLHLAPSTVRTHYKHLLAKLEAHDRAQLIRHAMRRRLLD